MAHSHFPSLQSHIPFNHICNHMDIAVKNATSTAGTNSQTSLAKSELREKAIAARNTTTPTERANWSAALAQSDLPFVITSGMIVAAYYPIGSELDVLILTRRLITLGAQIALPIVSSSKTPLSFRAWAPSDEMDAGQMNILEPRTQTRELTPDILLVPLLKFDRSGVRLGYGAGHYDRTLGQLRAARNILAVGISYGMQEQPHLPFEPHDQRLDLIMTEDGTTACSLREAL